MRQKLGIAMLVAPVALVVADFIAAGVASAPLFVGVFLGLLVWYAAGAFLALGDAA